MKGLLYKDLVTIYRQYRANWLLVLVLYTLLGFALEMPFFFYALPFLMGGYMVGLLASEESCGWESYARTLPVTLAQRVGTKYLLGLLLTAVGGALSLVLMLLTGAAWADALAGSLGAAAATLLYLGVHFPMQWKFGTAKARSWTLALVGATAAAILLLIQLPAAWAQVLAVLFAPLLDSAWFWLAAGPLVVLGLYAVSFGVSMQVCKGERG